MVYLYIDIRKINIQRLINIRIQEKDKIHIPKPTYGQGANRRSRFAFGRISKELAKTNTAKHNKELQEERQNNTITEKPMIEGDSILQEQIRQEEEEENIFLGNDDPDVEDCA